MSKSPYPSAPEFLEFTQNPVPLDAGNVTGWKAIELEPTGEPLVPVGAFSKEAGNLLTSSVYFGEHNSSPYIHAPNRIDGALLSVFMRQGVAQRLLKAQSYLPDTHRLLIFDAYRPLEVQRSLFDFYRRQLAFRQPDMNASTLDVETQKYVSMPTTEQLRPPPHNTGGSVDLAIVELPPEHAAFLTDINTQLYQDVPFEQRVRLELQKSAIIRRHARLLNFGTAFDHGGERAAIAYFEKRLVANTTLTPQEFEACQNRRLLHDVMTEAGMEPYEAEWWHFNAPESQMGAASAGQTLAIYGAVSLSPENTSHEALRRHMYDASVRLQEERMGLLTQVSIQNSLDATILATLVQTGEPRMTGDWRTEVIAPLIL